MLKIITDSIHARQEISFIYSGIERVAQPVAVGASRAGRDVLRCYQTKGGHVTAGHVWDLCEISLMSNVKNTGVAFDVNPPGYKRGDKHMIKIYAEI